MALLVPEVITTLPCRRSGGMLGRLAAEKRGLLGVRAAAKEIGISAATLSRVERGFLPDLETFRKSCQWLGLDASEVLGLTTPKRTTPQVTVHFKKLRP